MSINIRPRNDYSTLFAGLYAGNSSNKANMLGINLSDYASLKSGSYGKLMKAYYSKDRSEEVEKAVSGTKDQKSSAKRVEASEDKASTIAKLEKDATAISSAVKKLQDTGKDSLFAEKEMKTKNEDGTETVTKGYDRDAIYEAAASFADGYNNLIATASASANTRVNSAQSGLVSLTDSRAKALEGIGIAVGKDHKLSVDKDKFNEADVEKVRSLLQGSYTIGVQNRADLIGMYAKNDAARASGVYGSSGAYANNLSSGSLYNGIF